jgi:hypothetical protein
MTHKHNHTSSPAPVQVTAWADISIESGAVYLPFWSGDTPHSISMGPAMALMLALNLKRALINANIVPIPANGSQSPPH